MNRNPLTPSQRNALAARGNVLVVAGAGTGKTHTLIERCCSLLLDGSCSIDEILMVTFTEAASAEMRKRIRARLADRMLQSEEQLQSRRLEEQIALLDTACISTLHSFCLRLVREHFYDELLRLDPEFVVLSDEQLHQLRNNTLDALLEEHYGGDSPQARAFQQLVARQAGGNETRIRDLIWQLHRYSRSLADPAGWFEKQLAMFAEPEPVQWRKWLKAGFAEWREHWLPELEALSETPNVADSLKALRAARANVSPEELKSALAAIQEAHDRKWPHGTAGTVRNQIKDFFSGVEFLASLLPGSDAQDPLAQDWQWARGQMQTLLQLAREFGGKFDDARREAGGVDFSDLEQFALRLLWNAKTAAPTPLAREWQSRLKFVFVDEYQDINEAQDTILRALSREGAGANRFLVGDVKQSIYRFRLADPKIFQAYKKLWSSAAGGSEVIPLSDNFRSREALLDFVNSFFALFMREEVGGVAYDNDARLKFGAPKERVQFSRKADASPPVEIHLRLKTTDENSALPGDNGSPEPPAADFVDLGATEKEARLVALQLKRLRQDKLAIWDVESNISRPVEWRDMVVLLRSPRNKVEIFAREFNRAGVPLHARRESFYSATEISDLICLLQLLDNPMQDLPLVAVLRSPLVGLSVDELAVIRSGQRDDRFWVAVLNFAARSPKESGDARAIADAALPKLKKFLADFDSWRRQAQQGSLSDCVRGILDATHYESLVLAQDRGEERLANVNRLLRLIRQFDPWQRQGLLRFLRFVDAQLDAEAEEEPASSAGTDAVRLLSIHQSKGLEFPVVAVADLSKAFNTSDLRADVLLDSEFGLCPRITPPDLNSHYPSLPYWLARRRQKSELLGEELRLLYVAMTRARDRLILTGSVSAKQFETRWQQQPSEISTTALLQARSYADWLAGWFARNCPAADCCQGETSYCRWRVHNDESLVETANESERKQRKSIVHLSAAETEQLRQKLSTDYPFIQATEQRAKTSVSDLRRNAMELLETDESFPLTPRFSGLFKRTGGKKTVSTVFQRNHAIPLSAAQVGIVHHRFLERVSFERVSDASALQAEAARMISQGVLSAHEAQWLDFNALLHFWRSSFGRKILSNAQYVHRELAFTARFSPAELNPERVPASNELQSEFVIVQGVADLAVILPNEIWLLDFKTDDVTPKELPEKQKNYGYQLKLYALALERIYRKPVTDCRLHFLSCGQTLAVDVRTA